VRVVVSSVGLLFGLFVCGVMVRFGVMLVSMCMFLVVRWLISLC